MAAMEPAAQHPRPDRAPAPAATGVARPRMLLIDDSPAQMAALVKLLEDHGDIQVATSGQRGLALARACAPDLILLDVQMPDLDGHAIARALHEDPATRHVPFIFLTVEDTTDAEQTGLELGATDFITKPVHGGVALRRILNHLDREQLRKTIEAERASLEARVAQRTAELERARNDAQAASRLKDAILRNLSHELRTPLNGIVGMLGLLRRQLTDEAAVRYVALAEQSAHRLGEVLSGLLDLAQLEAGVLTLRDVPYHMPDLISRVAATLRPAAAAKGLLLAATVDPACESMTCQGDPARIEQVLAELVRNAIKFSAQGTVTLHARAVDAVGGAGKAQREIRVSVADQGGGVDPGKVQAIFEPFVQVDSTRARTAEGNGIGLALSQGLARLMGGGIELEANSPAGTTFCLRLPRERHVQP